MIFSDKAVIQWKYSFKSGNVVWSGNEAECLSYSISISILCAGDPGNPLSAENDFVVETHMLT